MSRDEIAELNEADARARNLAQREFDRPLVVEAGAGTGKTTALVARVLAWSFGPGWDRAKAAAGVAVANFPRRGRQRKLQRRRAAR